ncbi:iron complex transport system permease protein [Aeromonas sp. RU39B]|uniref:FecCD family ABC transporter permease n=1 Tax=Aeromonas sp. RU39B TaxID=1907416 RepID=UPI00095594E0|nr:iron chelate uptake ABC transporter family permease subunit [Aeromonas sp. RU39B]SIR13507.1 iron complex transport system permease protein [Aeromonas sp. RU39B]
MMAALSWSRPKPEPRAITLLVLLSLSAVALLWLALSLGALSVTATDIWLALQGRGTPMLHTVIVQWRLPRALMALLCGLALGISGAVFQSLLRNPMGSPDVIGFNTGAYTGALVTVILLKGSDLAMAAGSLVGGCLTALVIFALAWQQGISRLRLIIVGIAVSAMLTALNIWLLMSSTQESALTAALWSAGSLNGITWSKAWPVMIPCLLLAALCCSGQRPLRQLELGDDLAHASGVAVQKTRLLLMLAGVALAAIATAMTGPIPFVALAAPQIAQRLGRSPSPSLISAGLTGAVLLVSADLVAQHALDGIQLPVGVVTTSLGGLYLLVLLLDGNRNRS